MEEKKIPVLRVLTEISEAKHHTSNGDSLRSSKENDESPSLNELKDIYQTKRFLQKRNQLHPLLANHPYRYSGFQVVRTANTRPKPKDLSQRIVSAKLLQIKELRNQLTLSQHQLNEVTNENRFLKTLQKRQETALRKYEGQEARLPQLIKTHTEEIKVLNTKLKQVKITNHQLVEKLKMAENQLSSLQQQHSHLVDLSKNQQLEEREALAFKVQDLEMCLRDKTNTIQLLTRKVDLERKNYKHELGLEKSKRNEIQKKLSLAMQTIDNLKDQIEAKEKCMHALIPSRYIRGAPGQPYLNSSRLTHLQNLFTDGRQTDASNKTRFSHHTTQPVVRRNSMEQTECEIDIAESHNSKTTCSSRTLSGTTLPNIKPQISTRILRNQYKLSSKRSSNNNCASTNNETPDYSSSFTSANISLKDLRRNSDSDSEKSLKEKKQFLLDSQESSSRVLKYSVDSVATNKSGSGKITQRTNKSTDSSEKPRTNSISKYPEEHTQSKDDNLEHESLFARKEEQKSIQVEELRELEEKLLRSNIQESSKDKSSSDILIGEETQNDSSDRESVQENLRDDTWSLIHDKIKAESEAAEAKLEDYNNSLEKSDFNTEDATLEQEQKEQLLKALKAIDREAGEVRSESSTEDVEPHHSYKQARRKSDGYSFTKTIENLHKGRPVCDKVKIPVIEKMKKEDKMYKLSAQNGKKSKEDFMKELFGNMDISLHDESFTNEKPKERDRILQLKQSFN